jgi:hypothetical protein
MFRRVKKMTTYATYIGQDSDCGLTKGARYEVSVSIRDYYIIVQWDAKRNLKAYASLEAFLNNWEIEKNED